ncbi:MAG TPA: DUF664 domain-containing protein [Jiangellaceae bacterium]
MGGQLATRSVPPSTLPARPDPAYGPGGAQLVSALATGSSGSTSAFWSPDDYDLDFNGAVADQAVVDEAFAAWKAQIAAADEWLDGEVDLDAVVLTPRGDQETSVRDILIHMIEEYARHCGHADLLRECIDGRTGLQSDSNSSTLSASHRANSAGAQRPVELSSAPPREKNQRRDPGVYSRPSQEHFQGGQETPQRPMKCGGADA